MVRSARARATVMAVLALLGIPGLACRGTAPPPPVLDVVERVVAGPGADAPLPVLIAVHGLGDTPESFCGFVAGGVQRPARVICPRGPRAWGRGRSWFPPPEELTTPRDFADAVERAGEALAALARTVGRRPETMGLPVLIGYSQGGMVAYYMATRHSALLSAIVPIAGMLPPLLREPPRGREIPLVAFHGLDDGLVAHAEARATVDVLRSRWPGVRLEEYAGVGHRLSDAMRTDVFRRLDGLLAAGAGGSGSMSTGEQP